MYYEIKDLKQINNLNILTIEGNGIGVKNNDLLIDNNLNEYKINSIAMKDNIDNETCLVVSIIKKEKEAGKRLYAKDELVREILFRPYYYIDSFACPEKFAILKNKYKKESFVSLKDIVGTLGIHKTSKHDEELDVIAETTKSFDEYILQGLYLIINPDKYITVLIKAIENGFCQVGKRTEILERELTYYWNEKLIQWKSENKNFANMSKHMKAVYERQIRACKYFEIPFPYVGVTPEKDIIETQTEKQKILNKDIPAIYKNQEYYYYNENNILHENSWNHYINGNFDINNIGIAEKIFCSPYGLMNPKGDWFSCTFGGHAIKAIYIIDADKTLTEEFVNFLIEKGQIKEEEREKCTKNIPYYGHTMSGINTALDFLMSKRWCKISDDYTGYPIPVVEDEIRGMTKSQERTYFYVKEFFEKEKGY